MRQFSYCHKFSFYRFTICHVNRRNKLFDVDNRLLNIVDFPPESEKINQNSKNAIFYVKRLNNLTSKNIFQLRIAIKYMYNVQYCKFCLSD
jgi:hypothetical protein